MTIQDFQIKNSEWLKTILSSQQGQELMSILASMRPMTSESPHLHLYAEGKGQIRGYETCLRNIIALTNIPKVTGEPEINYGVPEKKSELEGKE